MTLIEPLLRWYFKEDHSTFSYPSQQGNSFGQILALIGWPCEFKKGCHKYKYANHKRCGHLRWIPFFRVDLSFQNEQLRNQKIEKLLPKLDYHRTTFIRLFNNLTEHKDKMVTAFRCNSNCAICYSIRDELMTKSEHHVVFTDFLRALLNRVEGYWPKY